MKKLNKYLLVIMLSLFIIPIVNVNAATLDVKTINASITDNKILVDGTVDNGVLAVAIMVYEEDGTTLVKMETTSVDSNDKYSDTIDVTSGKKYIVKVANYNGGTYVTAEVDGTVNNNNNNTNNENLNNNNNNANKENLNNSNNNTNNENLNNSNNNINNENLNNSDNNTTNTETSNKVDKTTNPKTGDNIILYGIMFTVALLGIIIMLIVNIRKNKKVRKH